MRRTHMKLFVTDLDGTLLSEITHISTQNLDALQELKKHDYELVIASGRPLASIQTMEFMNLKPYIIALNGAVICDPNGSIMMKQAFTVSQAEEIIAYCKKEELITVLYTDQQVYHILPESAVRQAYFMAKEMAETENDLIAHLEHYIYNFLSLDALDEVVWKRILDKKEHICKIEINGNNTLAFQKLEEAFHDRFHITGSWPTNREITLKGVNKGTALTALCEMLQIPLSDSVAIGDNNNDIEMLETAGFAIAMGNAQDAIKVRCDYVSDNYQAHGVAKAIAYLLHKK